MLIIKVRSMTKDVERIGVLEFHFDLMQSQQFIKAPQYNQTKKLLCISCKNDLFDELYINHYECDVCGSKLTIIPE